MASFKSQKAKTHFFAEMDLLSNLPEGVKEKILAYLPIKEAGRTSILSSKWRYIWDSIPELAFCDTKCIRNLVEFVNTILLLHSGPIRKFSLSTMKDYPKAFGRWIVNLSRNGIRELTLNLSGGEYMMHSRLFSCDELNCVNLTGCFFRVPLQFKGFKLLHTLEVTEASIDHDDLEKLISSCPLLKKMRLIDLWECVVLNINAPNLLSLEINANFSNLRICAPKLLSLCVWLRCPCESFQHSSEGVLGNLPDLESFELQEHFLARLSLTFNHLKNLDLLFDFGDEKEAAFVLALFQGAPHLQSLNIEVCLSPSSAITFPSAKFWERVDRREGFFKQLRTVNIVDFRAVDSILSFVKFLLSSAPQLVTLAIQEDPEYKEDERMMFKQLLQFERISPKAKIIFE